MDDHIYRTFIFWWTLMGLAWFAGIVNNIQSKIAETIDRHKVSCEWPNSIQYKLSKLYYIYIYVNKPERSQQYKNISSP